MKVPYIEISLVFMFVTGIFQWDLINISWLYLSSLQAIHIISSIIICIFLVIPFVNIHTYKYHSSIIEKKHSSKNGIILGIMLFLIVSSGFYLFFFGNISGDIIGNYFSLVHLYGSFILLFFLWYHKFFSVKNINKRKDKKLNKTYKHSNHFVSSLLFVTLLLSIFYLPIHASISSSALYLSKDFKYIYTANLDAKSISKINALTGEVIFEKILGKDIRRIAFKDDESVYAVTDYMDNKIIFLNSNDEIIKKIYTKNKPHAIIYDKRNKYFFVSIFEDAEILVINDNYKIIKTIKTFKTPRGLALSDDGRLLVSHSMLGIVSIYDSKTLKRLKTITLHETQNKDEFVSQGKPRLLDDIEITPDGKQAWLPHVLWNFDHPFQFQSTIYPSISIISLKPNFEKELKKQRKHLFKSINVLDNANKTMIVSNPWDLSFSSSGKKAFVTLASSEDIMVLNIARSMGTAKKKRHRKRAKRSGKGAKVTQIFRAYPNNTNPKAILVHPKNNNIYVQNASRLDMTLLNSGGEHPFARLKLKKDFFSKLVKKDPLNKKLRLGKTLFNNGNTNVNKDIPMAGDFWMSCNSCHFEGFNFTNSFLFTDFTIDKSKKASIGHDNLAGFVSKAPLGDYVRMIKDTQGGMGGDKNSNLPFVNPKKMSKKVKSNMQALHAYVKSNENLKYLSTWIKLEENIDKYHVQDWTNSAKCKSCHNDIFNQWANSNHKNLGGNNPYYMVLENIAAKVEGEEFRQWCMGCHNPSAVTTGIVKKTTDTMNQLFEQDGKTLIKELKTHGNSKLEEGVSCVACHRITKIEDAGGNASYTLSVQNRKKYTFEDNDNEALQYLSHKFINSKPKIHVKSYMKPVYKKSVYCASCHDEFSPGNGSKIVSTFKEWQNSPFNNPKDPKKHKTCIDCHMTYLRNGEFSPLQASSTKGGKIKDDVKVHYFSGSNHFLSGLKSKEHEKQSLQLLRRSAKLDLDLKDNYLKVGVTNIGAGHHLPTGVADFRQLWLEVSIKNKNEQIIFQSGKVDKNGNLDKNARIFMKVFADKKGKPVGLLFWKYEKLLSDTRIKAGSRRVESYNIKNVKQSDYPLNVSVKLNFRIYPQWVTNAVQKAYPQLPNPPVIQLEKTSKIFY